METIRLHRSGHHGRADRRVICWTPGYAVRDQSDQRKSGACGSGREGADVGVRAVDAVARPPGSSS